MNHHNDIIQNVLQHMEGARILPSDNALPVPPSVPSQALPPPPLQRLQHQSLPVTFGWIHGAHQNHMDAAHFNVHGPAPLPEPPSVPSQARILPPPQQLQHRPLQLPFGWTNAVPQQGLFADAQSSALLRYRASEQQLRPSVQPSRSNASQQQPPVPPPIPPQPSLFGPHVGPPEPAQAAPNHPPPLQSDPLPSTTRWWSIFRRTADRLLLQEPDPLRSAWRREACHSCSTLLLDSESSAFCCNFGRHAIPPLEDLTPFLQSIEYHNSVGRASLTLNQATHFTAQAYTNRRIHFVYWFGPIMRTKKKEK
ncbi:hypothetical protein A4X13_0g2869 [Tilletia indica]|uniref:Uncharacterized protein n=1 Tax=Tilletia indica TaxID=43049 RepID=A0A177TFP9_9BASI|nr:hypothetical protein A4X13_0g2869 [Tilletia indica]